jgi:hypothetical protein
LSLRPTFRNSAVIALAAILAMLAVSGCALDARKNLKVISQTELASGGEPYFFSGQMTYQIQESRVLNPYNVGDVQYLAGVKDAQSIPGNKMWFAVFLWAKNQSHQTQWTTDHFTMTDSSGATYYPTKLNPNINPYAWDAEKLSRDGIEPGPDTTAGYGPIGGGLILFELPTSVYSNRPLTLDVYGVGAKKASTVSLDL